jgi:hypothetical protein
MTEMICLCHILYSIVFGMAWALNERAERSMAVSIVKDVRRCL